MLRVVQKHHKSPSPLPIDDPDERNGAGVIYDPGHKNSEL